MTKRPTILLLAILLTAALLSACSSDPVRTDTAAVRVQLTDAPIDLAGVSAVEVTVDDMVLYPRDDSPEEDGVELGGPVAVPGGLDVNLLDYQGGQVVFVASGEVPAGSYRRIRLNVSSARLVRDDDGDPATPDLVEEIFIPSGKVDVPVPFSLSAGETKEITLDFDAHASVQVNETGGQHSYILRPVITPAGMRSVS